jgi:hypothetical protein
MAHTYTTWFSMILLAIPILFIGFILAVVITLIAIPATRKLAGVLLVLFLCVLVVLVGGLVTYRFTAQRPSSIINSHSVQEWSNSTEIPASQIIPPAQSIPLPPSYQPNPPVPNPLRSSPKTIPAAPDSPEKNQPLNKSLTSESRLIDVFSKILAKTILEESKAWQELAAKTRQQATPTVEKVAALAEAPVQNKPAPAAPPEPVKPDWVDRPLHKDGNNVYASVAVEPFTSLAECEAALPEAVQNQAIDPYLKLFLPEAFGKVRLSAHVLQNLVVDRWVEKRIITQGEVKILHARVQLERGTQDLIKDTYRQSIARRRLLPVGVYFSAGFLLLASAWGYLKIDLATGGKRRGTLRTAATLVILSIVAAAAIAV